MSTIELTDREEKVLSTLRDVNPGGVIFADLSQDHPRTRVFIISADPAKIPLLVAILTPVTISFLSHDRNLAGLADVVLASKLGPDDIFMEVPQ
jgi:hypothetical protein